MRADDCQTPVSTADQKTQNQRDEIRAAGFAIEAHRLVEETISGSVAAKARPGFLKLLDRMETGDEPLAMSVTH